MSKIEYENLTFIFDEFTKKIYMDGYRIWQDTDNHIGDPDYYLTFEDWVKDNYYGHIFTWLGIAEFDTLNNMPNDIREFIQSSDIYIIEDNNLITLDNKYVNEDDIREQMDYMRSTDTFE